MQQQAVLKRLLLPQSRWLVHNRAAATVGTQRCPRAVTRTQWQTMSSTTSNDADNEYASRIERLQSLGIEVYPPTIKPTSSVSEFIHKFNSIEKGSRLSDVLDITLCGRLSSIRQAGKKSFFCHLVNDSDMQHNTDESLTPTDACSTTATQHEVQIIGNVQNFSDPADYNTLVHALQRGDIVAVRGFPGKSRLGELSIVARAITILSPCLQPIPSGRGDGKFALKDKGVRYRNRHVDMLANRQVVEVFKTRARIMGKMRSFFNDRGFLSVETPVLSSSAGGAAARPFKTHLHAHSRDLELRIAPELYLKQLVVGGMDRVYELGRVFRNEGTSPTHNPEFTVCEAYQAYADYSDMMDMTESLLRDLCQEVRGSSLLPIIVRDKGSEENTITVTVDLSKPFQRISVIPELERLLGIEAGGFPDLSDPTDATLRRKLIDLCGIADISTRDSNGDDDAELSVPKLLDILVGTLIEPTLDEPTFLCHHPVCMSPLAKACNEEPTLTERFELFVGRHEICNAYTELNDPKEQMERFIMQQSLRASVSAVGDEKDAGRWDEDTHPMSVDFCEALEYGLPPTAGWGIGVDRLVMLLTQQRSIRDVILFPVV